MLKSKQFWGAVIIIIGIIFLLGNLDLIDYSIGEFFADFWPVILIIVGAGLIIQAVRFGENKQDFPSATPSGVLSRTQFSKVFGDQNIEAQGIEIDGLRCSTTFGDTALNLSGAKLKDGDNRIDVSSVFGDVSVILPGDFEARAHGSTTFGDVHIFGRSASGIPCNLTVHTDGFETARTRLLISTRTTFGTIRIHRA
jgi:predicted membrane protein